MQIETLTDRADLIIRRLTLEADESMFWHRDNCHRFTVVVRGSMLGIRYQDSGEQISVPVHAGLADWDAPELRIHQARNLGEEVYEEVVTFYRNDARQDPQPSVQSRVMIFGNSGSGKSTLARTLAATHDLAHLDLDTLAWLPGDTPTRAPRAQSQAQIAEFLRQNPRWVIEGCYTDLLELLTTETDRLIFLDLPESECVRNARNRPWEPHKYPDKAAQDANLGMLIDWIGQYRDRDDTFSGAAHKRLFDAFSGSKARYRSRPDER